jgi:purine nucleosidase
LIFPWWSPRNKFATSFVLVVLLFCSIYAQAQKAAPRATKQPVIIDTDIGDDIDDAFALALALRSPEFQILGVTTTFGDTNLRAKLVERYLAAAGRSDVPVAAGIPTKPKADFTQHMYAQGGSFDPIVHAQAADFVLQQIRKHPGRITLLCIGPLVNVGAMIDKDSQTFRKLKRVVMMGGSIRRGYDTDTSTNTPPEPEWNILNDVPSARKLFASGVPIYMMPLDATQLQLDEKARQLLFAQPSPISEVLKTLYQEWGKPTPVLYDPVTVAYALRPELCPTTPMHIVVDDNGLTRSAPGTSNAKVCLRSDANAFFSFYLERVAGKRPAN